MAAQTRLISNPLTQLAFSVYENKGVYAVLLGSGLSRSAEIPTGWEITLDLTASTRALMFFDRFIVRSLTAQFWRSRFHISMAT